jgi:parallel beta-helix repeat protein
MTIHFKSNQTVKRIMFLFILLVVSQTLYSTNYYADPINGSMSNSGTSLNPWSSLEDIMNSSNSFTMSDTIFLRTGNHGFPKINGINSGIVYITPQMGETPIIDRIYIGNVSSTSNWKLSGLTVQTENIATYPISLITLYPSSSNITIENCTIQSIDNTSLYTRNDWRDKTNHGIRSQGTNHEIIGNDIRNIAVGLSIESENTLVKNNIVQYFTIDGIRGLGNYCTYEENTIKDNIVVFTYTENHYDGFQSYTCCPVGADTLKGVIIRKNLIINCTDSTRLWRGPMQGIACFDGFFEDWTIENNIVITDHWHGITLLGAINCKIINNTVVDPYDISPIDIYDSLSTANHGPAWIKIAAHKNGSPSYNNIIYNNLTSDLQNDLGIGIVDFNITIGASTNYFLHFEDYQNYDYHLIQTSVAINTGTSDYAPLTDFEGNPRPNDTNFDIGAYEYNTTTNVANTQKNNDVTLYPNPVHNQLTLKGSADDLLNIHIYNILGQDLTPIVKQISNSESNKLIDLSNLNAGMYIIKTKTTTNIVYKK